VFLGRPPERTVIESPEQAAMALSGDLMWETQEHFAVLHLDIKHRLIGQQIERMVKLERRKGGYRHGLRKKPASLSMTSLPASLRQTHPPNPYQHPGIPSSLT
jgi:hypothetical protein